MIFRFKLETTDLCALVSDTDGMYKQGAFFIFRLMPGDFAKVAFGLTGLYHCHMTLQRNTGYK